MAKKTYKLVTFIHGVAYTFTTTNEELDALGHSELPETCIELDSLNNCPEAEIHALNNWLELSADWKNRFIIGYNAKSK